MAKDNEIWKDIIGYEGIYQISNKGSVFSLPKTWLCGISTVRRHYGKKLSPQINKDGYHHIRLGSGKDRINISIHILVAQHFVDNPNNLPEVNHINANKDCNEYWNLEWTTRSGNVQHAHDNNLLPRRYGSLNSASRLVLDTATGIFYESVNEAAKAKCVKANTLVCKLIGRVTNNTSLIYV